MFFKDPEHFRHPKFKRKKDDRDSFTACNHIFESGPTIYTTKDGIRMTKAGIVRAKFSRRPQAWWKLKRVVVDKTRTGKYYCRILYEYTEKAPVSVTPSAETALGLKYSARHFYAASDGSMADPPQWLKHSQEKLARIQRSLSRMQPGSQNYAEAVQKYRLLHEHIANQRLDFVHKESRRIANAWDAVCVRDGDSAALNRKGPAGFGMFRERLRYKLERQGKALIEVDRYIPTTRTYSACGCIKPEEPSLRYPVWTCPECGAVHKWEVNAARNIQAEGLARYLRKQERRQSA